jgi:hypothetical protein
VVRLLASGRYLRNCHIPDNARRAGQGSRATRTSAMSGRQVCGQVPGGPAHFTIYKGLVELTEYRSTGETTRRSSLTSVVIGTLAVGDDCWEEAAAQGPNRRAETEQAVTTATTEHRGSTEQEWPITCWTNYSMQVGGYSSCYCLPLFTLY